MCRSTFTNTHSLLLLYERETKQSDFETKRLWKLSFFPYSVLFCSILFGGLVVVRFSASISSLLLLDDDDDDDDDGDKNATNLVDG